MDVRAFVAANVTPVDEDLDSVLSPATAKTKALWNVCESLLKKEYRAGGVLDVDTTRASNVNAFAPSYIDGGAHGKLDDVVVVRDDNETAARTSGSPRDATSSYALPLLVS